MHGNSCAPSRARQLARPNLRTQIFAPKLARPNFCGQTCVPQLVSPNLRARTCAPELARPNLRAPTWASQLARTNLRAPTRAHQLVRPNSCAPTLARQLARLNLRAQKSFFYTVSSFGKSILTHLTTYVMFSGQRFAILSFNVCLSFVPTFSSSYNFFFFSKIFYLNKFNHTKFLKTICVINTTLFITKLFIRTFFFTIIGSS